MPTMDRVTEACLLNAELRRWQGEIGLRRAPVHCLSRDGRAVSFAEPSRIPHFLRGCLEAWELGLASARDAASLARACARFWMTFISIHPFADANGRTAKELLRRSLAAKGIEIRSFEWIDRYLIEGDPRADLPRLAGLFLVSFGTPPNPVPESLIQGVLP